MSSYQWFLWVVQDMCEGVHPHLIVGRVHSHSLLTHGGLVSVTRGLVVIGEGDD